MHRAAGEPELVWSGPAVRVRLEALTSRLFILKYFLFVCCITEEHEVHAASVIKASQKG